MKRALLVLLAACNPSPAAPDAAAPDAGPRPDASTVNCGPTDPRTPPLQVFVAPTGFEQRMLDFIDGATTSLDVQMYLFTVSSLRNRLIAAEQRGVAVRVLLDPDEAGNTTTFADLQAAHVPVEHDPAQYPYAHAKYLIADRARAVIMSANFNYGALDSERNYGAITSDPDDLADLQAIFDSDFAQDGSFADLACTRLLVSPVNTRQRVLDLINGASSTLDLEVLYVTDTSVKNAIVQAHQRGVTVRVMLADPANNSENAATASALAQVGIAVEYLTQYDLHAKLVIADGVALVGSENLSQTSLVQNREVGVLVPEQDQVAIIQTQYDADWAIGIAP